MKTFPILLTIGTLLPGCAAFDPHNMMGRRAIDNVVTIPDTPVPLPVPPGLAPRDRERAFDFVWNTINDRYYDPKLNGVDWRSAGERFKPLALGAKDDDAFWDALDRMTGELKDAHTRVESPKRAEQIRNDESISLGFAFIVLDGKLVVSSVHPDSDAWWAGVRPGMRLAAIDGEDAAVAFEKLKAGTRLDSTERSRHLRAVRKLSAGELDSKRVLAFERADGTRIEATLKRRKMSTAAATSHRVLPSGYGYVRLTQWTFRTASRVAEAIQELKTVPGMVIDLRGNPGGSLHAVRAVMRDFFPSKTEIGRTVTRTGKAVSLFFGAFEVINLKLTADGGPDAYTGAVAILVNESSGSASEFFAGSMQALGRATVVGQPTCGCLLGFLGYASVPGGGELAYSEVGFVMANGKRIEGEGVIPDKAVPVALADLQANRDRALEEAQVLLRTMKPWKSEAKVAGGEEKR